MRILLQAESTAAIDELPIPERMDIKAEDMWNLEPLYDSPEAWEMEFAALEEKVKPLEAMRGQMNSATALADAFGREEELNRLIEKLYVYAHLRKDEDTRNNENQARESRMRARLAEIGGRLAWMTPEILSHSGEELRAWSEAPELASYVYAMTKLLRRKPHVLSEPEETLLSRASEVFSAPSQTYTFLTNADMKFPEAEDSQGRKLELTQGRYGVLLQKTDRALRHSAFNAMYDTIGSFRNTLACTLSSNVKLHNYMAETRHFNSALESSLHEDQIPVSLYEALIHAAHEALPHFYKYVSLRKNCMQLNDLDMYDMYVPIVPDFDMKVSYDQAAQWVVEACAPLGEEYVSVLKEGLAHGWVDRYENRGKRSGAYSSGCYDSHPYVLMNYHGQLNDVFTLAHELGHSMHSYLSNHTQPYHYADYPIFIAEIASTLNEALLLRYLLQKHDDPKMQAYLLNHFCDEFKGTVYRQTMFGEFEKHVHEMDANGEPLTPDALCDYYYNLNQEFFGPELKADQKIALEWARIPHFYYNFYVYKYATSLCASLIFVEQVLSGVAGREKYLNLLRSGGSNDPLKLIQNAGVDLTSTQTLVRAFEQFGRTADELAKCLDEIR